jgi:hypothetical protein
MDNRLEWQEEIHVLGHTYRSLESASTRWLQDFETRRSDLQPKLRLLQIALPQTRAFP